MVLGSASYLAPEQAQGQPATARTDLYATGVVLFEMLTGRLPFMATTPLAVAVKHVEEMPPSPSSVNPSLPRGLDAVVLKALSKDPEARYGSGAELVAALEREFAPAEPAAAATVSLQPRAPEPPLSIGELAARRQAVSPAETGASALAVAPRPLTRLSHRWRLVAPLAVVALAAAAGLAWAMTHGVPAASGRPQRHATAGAATYHQHTAAPSATAAPYAAVGAARHKHYPRRVRPVAPRRQPTATSSLRVTLEIARGESQTGATYVAQGRTTRFTTASVAAYAVARWRVAPVPVPLDDARWA